MKSRWITVGLCLIAVVVVIVRLTPHGRSRGDGGPSRASRSGRANPYLGLRAMVLQGTRANFGLGAGSSPVQPFAVVSDWGDGEGTTTIIAIADGSASVYRSNGAGSIGGGQAHASIRNAALKVVEAAGAVQPQMRRTTEYPLPARGQVSFYAVTDAGVFAATASRDDVINNRSPFSALGAAAQSIATEYERVETGR
jgi:hypothetical protein